MGWEIVSEESKEAREHSRLWHCDDIPDVLKKNTVSGLLYRHKFREVYNSCKFLLYLAVY